MGSQSEVEYKTRYNVGYDTRKPRPSFHFSNAYSSVQVEERARRAKLSSRSYHFRTDDPSFIEASFHGSHAKEKESSSGVGLGGDQQSKRGSMYHSSSDVRKMKSKSSSGEPKACSTCIDPIDAALILSCEEEHRRLAQRKERLPPKSSSSSAKSKSAKRVSNKLDSVEFLDFDPCNASKDNELPSNKPCSTEGFIEFRLSKDEGTSCCNGTSTNPQGSTTRKEVKSGCGLTQVQENFRDESLKSEGKHVLTKASSMRQQAVDSTPSELEGSRMKSVTRMGGDSSKKTLVSMTKSKSIHGTSTCPFEQVMRSDPTTISSRPLRKCLLPEFSKTSERVHTELKTNTVTRSSPPLGASSPAYLRSSLQVSYKHGSLTFEFTTKDPEDFITAKTYRSNNAFNWVYTFHSTNNSKRKRSTHSRNKKDATKQSSLVGQMKVRCYLCSETRDHKILDSSAILEFVLFDVTRLKTEVMVDNPGELQCSPSQVIHVDDTDYETLHVASPAEEQMKYMDPCSLDSPTIGSQTLAALDSQTHLQVAAMVIEVPLEKKGRHGTIVGARNMEDGKDVQSSLAKKMDASDKDIKVVIPCGRHGRPDNEEGGPSPLLERCKPGGTCDCGGWDMACPVIVFDNCETDCGLSTSTERHHHSPFQLFFHGRKGKEPALSIIPVDKGSYSVEFHAQFSSLQAFAICVAILHSTDVSVTAEEEKNRQRLHGSNAMKALIENEVKSLVKIKAEDQREKTSKRTDLQTHFKLDPPFSPIGRV